jgi:hypothetical protein
MCNNKVRLGRDYIQQVEEESFCYMIKQIIIIKDVFNSTRKGLIKKNFRSEFNQRSTVDLIIIAQIMQQQVLWLFGPLYLHTSKKGNRIV